MEHMELEEAIVPWYYALEHHTLWLHLQVGASLDTVEQLIEEQSLDILSADR